MCIKFWSVSHLNKKTSMICVSVHPKTPVLTVTPSNATVASGTEVNLTCHTTSIGTVTYTFLQNGDVIGTSEIDDNFNLTSVTSNDTGHYTCQATMGGVHSSVSNVHTIKVVGE